MKLIEIIPGEFLEALESKRVERVNKNLIRDQIPSYIDKPPIYSVTIHLFKKTMYNDYECVLLMGKDRWNGGEWESPRGKLRPCEEPCDGVVRILYEEIGLDVSRLIDKIDSPGYLSAGKKGNFVCGLILNWSNNLDLSRGHYYDSEMFSIKNTHELIRGNREKAAFRWIIEGSLLGSNRLKLAYLSKEDFALLLERKKLEVERVQELYDEDEDEDGCGPYDPTYMSILSGVNEELLGPSDDDDSPKNKKC